MTEPTQTAGRQYDLLIRGGLVFDGTGAAGRHADIGVVDNHIAAVGDLSEFRAGRVLEARGLHVAPGFIDIHTHSDISALYDPGQASHLGMGVTTQVTGNCGLSLGFATDSEVFQFERRWLAPHRCRITWTSFAEHLQRIEETGAGTNWIALAGHGTLRKRVVGMEDRPADSEEKLAMRSILEAALEAGAWGFSSGLEYPPSSYAEVEELAELCRVVAAHGGFYATHLRNEGDELVEAVQEAMETAERGGVPLQLSHHKAEGASNWGKVKTTLKIVEAARARGLDVQMDQYPYTAFMTGLAIQTLPRYALSGTQEETTARLLDPVRRGEIAAAMRSAHPDWDDVSQSSPWNNVRIGVCRGHPELQGRTVTELAREAGRDPIDFVLTLLAETGGFVSAVNFAIGEEDIALVMRSPWTSIGSDGVGTHPGGPASEDRIHPRTYGTFPRVLGHYVRDLGVLTEPEALFKMTALPAARMGLTDRGRIAPGLAADITLYDPLTIADRATFADPHQFATGIRAVLVNGRVAWEDGGPTGVRVGRVLRKAR